MSDLSTYAGQTQHYAAVRARLRGVPPRRVLVSRTPAVAPEMQPEPAPEPEFKPILILAMEELPPDTVLVPIPAWKRIAREVAQKHGVTVRDMTGPWRNERFVIARHEAMYRCSQELDLSFPTIGRLFGGRDHTTVLHAVQRHLTRMGLAATGKSISGGRFVLTAEKLSRALSLRGNGKTWAEVGAALGVSGRRAQGAVSRELERMEEEKRLAA